MSGDDSNHGSPVMDGPFAESKELLVGSWPEIPRAGRYAFVNGLRMYNELHGDGRPLVLHGALIGPRL